MLAGVAERIRAALNTEKLTAEQAFAGKHDQLRARVAAAVQAIRADGQRHAQSAQVELQQREQEIRTRFHNARTGITAGRDTQKQEAATDEQATVGELHTAVAAKRQAATDAATQESTLAFETGRTHAGRAHGLVTSSHAAIDSAAGQAVTSAHPPSADVHSAVQAKLSESSRSIKDDVRDKGNNVARGATETAETVARGIHDAGVQLAGSIDQGSTDVERSIRDGTAGLTEQIDQQVQESLTKLDDGEAHFADGLSDVRAQLVPGIQSATEEAVQRMQHAGDQAISGLEAGRTTTNAGFDQAAVQVLGQLSGAGNDVAPEDALAFESQATAAFAQLRTGVQNHLEQATGNVGTGIQTAQTGFGQALAQQQTELNQRVDHAVTETGDIAQAPQALVERCQQAREQLLLQRRQGIQQWGAQADGKIADARAGWTTQRTQAEGEIRGKVDEFQTQSHQMVAAVPAQFLSAATSAVASASGSWLSQVWEGIKQGFSRFFDGMKWFVLAFVVVFAVCVVVMAVIAGGISLAVVAAAAALALTIVGIGFLIYGLITSAIHRISQWIAAPQPWWAKIICIPYLVAVIVGDVIGFTPLLEGIFGHDAISLEELSTQESWARITQGTLSILALLLMRRAGRALGARGTGWRGPGTPPADPGAPPVDPNAPPAVDPNAPPAVDPNAPPAVDPNAPPAVDPNAPPAVDPNAPVDPNRPPVDPNRPPDPNPPRPAYDPTGRTMAQLQGDRNPRPRPGETPDEAATRARLAQDEILRRAPEIIEQLGDEPRRVNVRGEEPARVGQGAHTIGNHGADIPLRVADNPGGKTIEGRVTDPVGPGWETPAGDPAEPSNASFKWISDAVMNNVINNFLRANWEAIKVSLALDGRYATAFDSGNLAGEGFVNEGMGGNGPRNPVYAQTSLVRLVLILDPGPPATFWVYTTFPNYLGTPAH